MEMFLASTYLILVGMLFVYVGIRTYIDERKINKETAWKKSRFQIYVPVFMLLAVEILIRK